LSINVSFIRSFKQGRIFNKVFDKLINLNRKQALTLVVFKLGLCYFQDSFEHPIYSQNALIAKEKGLLEIEESYDLKGQVQSYG